MYEEEEALAESFKMQYKNGCRSPFLYIETVRLFGKNPELLKTMDAFEIHALYYGVMNGLVGQELAERIGVTKSNIHNILSARWRRERSSSTACITACLQSSTRNTRRRTC